MKLDRHDLKLLALYTERVFEFPTTESQRRRSQKLASMGYLFAKTEPTPTAYRGAKIGTLITSYRRTEAGTHIVQRWVAEPARGSRP